MKRVIVLLVALVFCLVYFSGVSHAADKVIKLEFSNYMVAGDSIALILDNFCQDIEKRTNGRVHITHHIASTLTPPLQTFDSVISGIADLGAGSTGYNPGRFPVMEVMDLPLGMKTGVFSTKVAMELYKKFQPKEFKDVKVLILYAGAPFNIFTKTPVRKLEDLAGKKIRCPGGSFTKVVKALGATPIMLPWGEVYDGLSKGVVDGVVAISDNMKTLKWGEIVHNATFSDHTSSVGSAYIVMNKDKWNSLPPDIQKIFDATSEEYTMKVAQGWDQKDKEARAWMKEKSHTIITLPPAEEQRWADKMTPLYDEYVKEKTAKGVPAAEILKFARDYIAKNQK